MKKIFYFSLLFALAGSFQLTRAQHKIAIQFFAQATNLGAVEIYADTINEGQIYTIQQKTLPSSYGGAQALYDALVGTEFYFQSGSLNQDIVIGFFISDIDLSTGSYASQNAVNVFFDVNFSVSDWNGNLLSEPFNLNSGTYAILKINKTTAFNTFIAKTGLDINAALKFVYETSTGFDLTGISTTEDASSVTAEISHFSHIVGSNASSVTGIKEQTKNMPLQFALKQNYPNPFNPSTNITYELPKSSFVQLTVYNILGEKIATLVNATKDAGVHSVQFNAGNITSGLYIYQLKAGNVTLSRKMMLLK